MKPFIAGMVCNVKNKDCMFRRCDACMDKHDIVKKEIEKTVFALEQTVIRYKRWLSTDGTKFVCEEKSSEGFVDFTTTELVKLLKHHYISIAQNSYLRDVKEKLKPGEWLVWGDFAENYTPVLQGSIQSQYFGHHLNQIILHPFNLYMKLEDEIVSIAYCIISDCNTHDTNSFYAFQKCLIEEVQRQIRHMQKLGFAVDDIKKITYFSDGCAAQYKNRKNFCNLFYHDQDFGIKAEWNFLATAHGKGPCDGHGGTTKRLARIASERGAIIQTVEELYNYSTKSITGIGYLLVTDEQINNIVETAKLTERFASLNTIQGTQQAHRVVVSEQKLILYETSYDTEPLTSKVLQGDRILPEVFLDISSVNDWVACVYDNKWYIAIIDEVSVEDEEVFVTFYKTTTKTRSEVFIPEGKNAKCWIPYGRVLKKLAPPRASRGGRTVTIPLKWQEEIDQLFELFSK